MIKVIRVFVDNDLHREYTHINRLWPLDLVIPELKEHGLHYMGYILIYINGYGGGVNGWWDISQKQVILDYVPKELRLLNLLLS